MRQLAYIIPIALFVVLTIFLFHSLIAPPPSELPSMLIDKPAPALSLPPLDANAQSFGPNDFKGHVTVLNVFASWCVPCREEAPALASLSSLKGVALYGMVYKDTPEKARAFLADVGNPFARIALDADGRAGIDWGVYGVPETFVIDPRGIVRYRFAGGLDAGSVTAQLLPAIAQARQ
jgi:cytochrome c biogenesis protein CcmG, thiol:disulfide interchange protein DsbE